MKKTSLIAKYLFELSEISHNRITLSELTRSAESYARANVGTPALLTMDMWLRWGLSKGLKLPKNITAFSRGIGAVEQLTLASGSTTFIADMVKQVAMNHKLELAPDLFRFATDNVRSTIDNATRRFRGVEQPALVLRCEAMF